MTAEIWYGRWPEHDSEQDALLKIYRFLRHQEEQFLIMTQFRPGRGNEIDLAVIKSKGIFLIELKHIWDKIVGGTEGDWNVILPDESEKSLRINPGKQLSHAYWQFSDWCKKNQQAISEGIDRPWLPDYKKGMFTYIVITPDLHKDSQIQTPPYIETYGLEDFLLTLVMREKSVLDLWGEEIDRFPKLLQLTRWNIKFPEEIADLGKTKKIKNTWIPPAFTGLVSLGHAASLPELDMSPFGKDGVTIGRGKDNDLVVEDDTVSRHHAKIYYHEATQKYIVEDLNSTSGTYVNYQGSPSVQENQIQGSSHALKSHSVVRFGRARFIFLENQ